MNDFFAATFFVAFLAVVLDFLVAFSFFILSLLKMVENKFSSIFEDSHNQCNKYLHWHSLFITLL